MGALYEDRGRKASGRQGWQTQVSREKKEPLCDADRVWNDVITFTMRFHKGCERSEWGLPFLPTHQTRPHLQAAETWQSSDLFLNPLLHGTIDSQKVRSGSVLRNNPTVKVSPEMGSVFPETSHITFQNRRGFGQPTRHQKEILSGLCFQMWWNVLNKWLTLHVSALGRGEKLPQKTSSNPGNKNKDASDPPTLKVYSEPSSLKWVFWYQSQPCSLTPLHFTLLLKENRPDCFSK